jgi:hypothetical protein
MSDLFTKLAADLARQGAPVLGGLIGAAIGGPAGAAIGGMAGRAIETLAETLGTEATPGAIAAEIATNPDAAAKLAEAEARFADLLAAEQRTLAELNRPVPPAEWRAFRDGWRPALCWAIIACWLNSLILAPYVAAFGVKLPMMPLEHLLAFSTVTLTVLGGGHTAKAIWGKPDGARG